MNRAILEAITGALSRILSVLHVRRVRLPSLLRPEDCPAAFLPDLVWSQGLTDEFALRTHITTETQWRRLAKLLPGIMREKGQADAYRDIVRAVAAARSYVFAWQELVATPTAYPGVPWTTVSTAAHGDWQATVGVEDAGGDLSRDMVEDALEFVRPNGEGLLLVFALMIENWSEGTGRWQDAGTVSDAGDVLTLGPDADADSTLTYAASTPDPAEWTHAHLDFIAMVSVGTGRFRFRIEGADYYEIQLTAGASAGNIVLSRSGSGVATATYGIDTATGYYVTVSTYPLSSGSLEIQVRIDGTLLITYTDASPHAPGPVRFGVATGTSAMTVAWAAVHAGGPETRALNI
ncbi:MAG: phage tail protein [Dehalococcoidia bacterium]